MTPLRSSTFFSVQPTVARPVSVHQFGVAHQTSLRSPWTMMSYSNSLRFREAGSLFSFQSLHCRTIYRSRHPRTGTTAFLPHLSAATELLVIDLVAQHDPETNPEFASYSDSRFSQSLLYQLAPVETLQLRISPYRMHRCLAPRENAAVGCLACSMHQVAADRRWNIRSGSSRRSWPPLCRQRTAAGSPKNTSVANAVTGPTPGWVINRRAWGRCQRLFAYLLVEVVDRLPATRVQGQQARSADGWHGEATARTRSRVGLLGSTASCRVADRDSVPWLAAYSALASASVPTDDGAAIVCADRVARSKASKSRESDFLPVASAATPRPADRVSVCVSPPCESSPDDPLGNRSSAPPSAPETSASIRWLRSLPGPGPAVRHRTPALLTFMLESLLHHLPCVGIQHRDRLLSSV